MLHVPEQPQISSGHNAEDDAIHWSEFEPVQAVHWQGSGSLGVGSASTLIPDTYGKPVHDVVPVVAG